jgi:gliding motility-associated lipoprotein GldH
MTSPVSIIYKIPVSINRIMTRNPEKKTLLLFLLLIVTAVSCDSNRVFEEHVALKEGVWNVRNQIRFTVEIPDLLSRYSMFLNVRNGTEYPYSNLFLFMNTVSPDGMIARDTIELTLADYDGRWLGSGMGSIKFSRFLFQKDFRFKQTGTYRFMLEQAMRVRELNGIHDIGLRIEKQ